MFADLKPRCVDPASPAMCYQTLFPGLSFCVSLSILSRPHRCCCIMLFISVQVMHKVITPHFDVEKSPEDRTYIYGCENDHG